jgi:integrase
VADHTHDSEQPKKPQPRSDFGHLYQRGKRGIYWARYHVNGKQVSKSLRTASRKQAEKKLHEIEYEVSRGIHTAPEAGRLRYDDLEAGLLTYSRNKGLRSLPRIERALGHLRAFFGGAKALAVTTDRIEAYATQRREAGAALATVGYEKACLRKAFNLAVAAGRLPHRPRISTPSPDNARTGFFEADDFAAVLAELPTHLQRVMRFAYATGWRVPSEVLTLTWERVDFRAGVVRLDANTTWRHCWTSSGSAPRRLSVRRAASFPTSFTTTMDAPSRATRMRGGRRASVQRVAARSRPPSWCARSSSAASHTTSGARPCATSCALGCLSGWPWSLPGIARARSSTATTS